MSQWHRFKVNLKGYNLGLLSSRTCLANENIHEQAADARYEGQVFLKIKLVMSQVKSVSRHNDTGGHY